MVLKVGGMVTQEGRRKCGHKDNDDDSLTIGI